MTATAVLRPARSSDLPAILRIESSAFSDPWSADSWHGEITRPESIVLVAASRDGIHGYVVARRGVDDGEILRVAVESGRRRTGLGSQLLRGAAEALHDAGATRLFLEVRVDNLHAIALYESCGLRAVGRRDHYYADGADALVFHGRLPLPEPGRRGAGG